jgi:poly(A) polymerase
MAPISVAEVLSGAAEVARELKMRAFLVGGSSRRLACGYPLTDLDIVVFAEKGAAFLGEALSKRLPEASRPISISNFPIVEVRCGETAIQISDPMPPPSSGSAVAAADLNEKIKADALRRDFTVNTLLLPLERPEPGAVIDPLGTGLADLKEGVLRTPLPADATIIDDPIRMLRAVRFSCVEGFRIGAALFEALKRMAGRIGAMPAERISNEFTKIITGPQPDEGLRILQDTGLLQYVLPEISTLLGMKQPEKYHDDDVFDHTLKVVKEVEPDLRTRLAALFHDVGKAVTQKTYLGRIVFHGHQHVGAEMSKVALQRLRYPKKVIDDVTELVRLHMVVYRTTWSDSAVRRLVRKAGDLLERLLQLYRADRLARKPPFDDLAEFDDLQLRLQAVGVEHIRRLQLPLSGGDVMELLGIRQGPRVGVALKTVESAILDGRIPNDREEARRFLLSQFGTTRGEAER